jgi:hypothetical protein
LVSNLADEKERRVAAIYDLLIGMNIMSGMGWWPGLAKNTFSPAILNYVK